MLGGRDIFIGEVFFLAIAVLSVAMYFLLRRDIESNRRIFANSEKMSAHSFSTGTGKEKQTATMNDNIVKVRALTTGGKTSPPTLPGRWPTITNRWAIT